MTIVCYRDGVMAADSVIVATKLIYGCIRKVAKTSKGALVGGAGSGTAFQRFVRFVEKWEENQQSFAHFDLVSPETLDAIVVLRDGTLVRYPYGGLPLVDLEASYIAVGTAEDMAMGALAAGASAVQAVEICKKHFAGIAGEIHTVELEKP